MIESFLMILKHALGIYETQQARRYLDRVVELEKERYEESNRPRVNHAVLDNIDAELRIIAEATAKFGKPNPTTGP